MTLAVVCAMCGSGCWTVPEEPRLAGRELWLDGRGQVAKPLPPEEAIAGRSFSRRPTVPDLDHQEVFDTIAREAEAGLCVDEPPPLTLFIHGGLSSNASIASRRDILDQAAEEGVYPLFINWDSSLWSSYFQEHWFRTRGGREVAHHLGIATFPFVLAGDLARGVAQAPTNWLLQLRDIRHASYDLPSGVGGVIRWALRQVFEDTDQRKEHKHNEQIAETLVRTQPERILLGEPAPRRFRGLTALAWLAGLPVRLVGAPLVQGNGASAWRIMKRRVDLMFRNEAEFLDPDAEPSPMPRLLRVLAELQERCPFQIDLVGHSMGALVANTILKEATRGSDEIPEITNIVYMASADSVRGYLDSAVPYAMKRLGRTKIYHLTLHPNDENTERHPSRYFDFVPPGSLLVWIDEFYEEPETLLDFTAGRFENLMHSERYLPAVLEPYVSYKIFPESRPGAGFPIGQHGDFDNAPFWRESFRSPEGDVRW